MHNIYKRVQNRVMQPRNDHQFLVERRVELIRRYVHAQPLFYTPERLAELEYTLQMMLSSQSPEELACLLNNNNSMQQEQANEIYQLAQGQQQLEEEQMEPHQQQPQDN